MTRSPLETWIKQHFIELNSNIDVQFLLYSTDEGFFLANLLNS